MPTLEEVIAPFTGQREHLGTVESEPMLRYSSTGRAYAKVWVRLDAPKLSAFLEASGDRVSDVLALAPGDRVRVTGLLLVLTWEADGAQHKRTALKATSVALAAVSE